MGLFDDPAMLPLAQQQQDTQSAIAGANMPVGRGGVYASNIAGNMIGRGIGAGLGYQDPRQVQAQKMQLAMRDTQASGLDFTKDPTTYMTLAAQNLFKYGLYDQGMAVADKIKEQAQGGFALAQTKKANQAMQQDTEAEQAVAQIMQQTAGDEDAAISMMRTHANPLVQKRGEELKKGRYLPVPEHGLLDTRTNQIVAGSQDDTTELAKHQTRRDAIKTAIEGAKSRGDPPTHIESLQSKLDETNDKISLLSKGKPSNTMVERSTKTLTSLLAKRDAGEKLTHEDYIAAIGAQGAIESDTKAVVDPNTGNVTYVQNTVPKEYSVQTLFGGKPQAQAPSGARTNPVPGTVTQSQAGNAKVTTIAGQGARPSGEEIKVLSEGDSLRGTLADMDKLMKDDYVGPISGRYGAFKGKTIGNDQDRAEFMTKAATYKNRTIKFITGAAMSEAETKRLINEIPDVNDPPSTFRAKLKASQDNIGYVMKAYQQNMQQGGVRVIGGNPVSPNQPVLQPPGAPVPQSPTPRQLEVTQPVPPPHKTQLIQEGNTFVEYYNGKPIYRWKSQADYERFKKSSGQ